MMVMNKDKKIKIQQLLIESLEKKNKELEIKLTETEVERDLERELPKDGYEKAKKLIVDLEGYIEKYKYLIGELEVKKNEYQEAINEINQLKIKYNKEMKNIVKTIKKNTK